MKKVVFLLFIACCMYSCNSKELKMEEGENLRSFEKITVKNGMLVFPNDSVFALVMNGKIDIPVDLNFTSQAKIFNTIMEEEEKFSLDLETMNVTSPEMMHSELYKEKLKSGFIKIIKYSDGAELYDLNICLPHYANILNEKGFYAIENNVYQVTPKGQKVWLNGDLNNYNVLAQTDQSDESKGIYVIDYSRNANIKTAFTPFEPSSLNFIVRYSIDNNYRYYVKVYDETMLIVPPVPAVSYNRQSYINVVAQKKSSGRWNYYTNFSHTFAIRIYIEDASGNFLRNIYKENDVVGGNIYYSMYLHPQSLGIFQADALPGKLEYNSDYIYLGAFQIGLTGHKDADKCTMGCEVGCYGYGPYRKWKINNGSACERVYEIGE